MTSSRYNMIFWLSAEAPEFPVAFQIDRFSSKNRDVISSSLMTVLFVCLSLFVSAQAGGVSRCTGILIN